MFKLRNLLKIMISLILTALIVKVSPTSLFASDITITTERSGIIQHGNYTATSPKGTNTYPDNYDFYMIKADGDLAFCIEPEILVGTGTGYTISDFTNKERDMFSKILYHGFYDTKQTNKDYVIAQNVLWDYIATIRNDLQISTGWYFDGFDYQAEKTKIMNKVNKHEELASFAGITTRTIINDSFTIEDNNGVLSNSSIIDDGGLILSKSGNSLRITTDSNSPEFATIKFKKYPNIKADTPLPPLLYSHPTQQKVIKSGNPDPIIYTLNIIVGHNGFLRIAKTNSETSKRVPNTIFAIADNPEMNNAIQYKTLENGETEKLEIKEGVYYLQEVSVPAPLVLNYTIQKLEVMAGTDYFYNLKNEEAKGKIEVLKKSTSGDDIANAKFEIKDSDNNVVDTLTTNNQGKAISKELALGDYSVVETYIPANLVLDKTPMKIKLEYKDQITPIVYEGVTKVNKYQRSNLEVSKVENDWDTLFPENNGIKLSDAKLELYAKANIYEGSKKVYIKDELVDSEVSDKYGNVKFHNLPIGEYYIKEKEAPKGYILSDALWNVSIKYDNDKIETEVTTTTTTLENQIAYGRSKIHKTGDNGLVFLKDAKFGLYKADGTLIDEFITDKKGEFISPDLRYGKYYWKELEAPSGYFTDNSKYHFEISEENHQETIHFPIDNKYIEIRLEVVKIDAKDNKPLANAIFEIRDENNEVVSFTYLNDNLEVVTQSQLITNTKGIAITQGFLKYGKYTLKEVQAPKGYLKSSPIEFSIDKNTEFVELPVLGKTTTQTVSNVPTTTEIIKLSENTGEPLDGATLELIHKDSKKVILSWVSDGAPVIFKGLYIGESYILKEVASPDGYFVSEPIEFVVKDTSDTQIITMLNELIPEIKTKAFFESGLKLDKSSDEMIVKDVVSYKDLIVGIPYTLKGSLINKENEEVITSSEVRFIPEKSNGTVEVEFIFDGKELIDTTLVVFEELYRDDILKAEHKDLADKDQSVYIPKIKTKIASSIKDVNNPDIITLTDTVSYSNLLPNQTYQLKGYIMDKNTGTPLIIDDKPLEATTTFTPEKSSGTVDVIFEINISDLDFGNYVIFEELFYESKIIAEHKDLEDADQTFSIIELIIEKIDKADKSKLEGVEFGVFDKDDNLLYKAKTNKSGKISFKLINDDYIIKELKELSGYLKNKKDLKVSLKLYDDIKELTIENQKVPPAPPTGIKASTVSIYLLLISSLYLIAQIFRKKQNKLQQ